MADLTGGEHGEPLRNGRTMPKGTSRQRRAQELAESLGISYTAALRIVDGLAQPIPAPEVPEGPVLADAGLPGMVRHRYPDHEGDPDPVIVIGSTLDGDLALEPGRHLVVTGGSSADHVEASRTVLFAARSAGWGVVVVDVGNQARILVDEPGLDACATTMGQAVTLLENIWFGMRMRQGQRSEHWPEPVNFRPVVVLVHEADWVLRPAGNDGSSLRTSPRGLVGSFLSSIARTGRAAGISLALVTDPESRSLFPGTVHVDMEHRILLGHASERERHRWLLNPDAYPQMGGLSLPGRGVHEASGRAPEPVQLWLADRFVPDPTGVSSEPGDLRGPTL